MQEKKIIGLLIETKDGRLSIEYDKIIINLPENTSTQIKECIQITETRLKECTTLQEYVRMVAHDKPTKPRPKKTNT